MRSNLRKEINEGYFELDDEVGPDDAELEQELIKQRVEALREISVTGRNKHAPPKVLEWCADLASVQTRHGYFVVRS